MCAMFVLRTEADALSFQTLIKCLTETAVNTNPLLEHELAYVLGQMCGVKDADVANPHKNKPENPKIYGNVQRALEAVLADSSRDSVVRHECGEALAAMLSYKSKQLLSREFQDKTNPQEVTETCD